MKYLIIVLIIQLSFSSKGQLLKTEYLNYYFKKSNDEKTTYIKETFKTTDGYKVIISTNNKCSKWRNEEQREIKEINYKSINPLIKNGYYRVEHYIGQYKDGEMFGIWYKLNELNEIIDTLDYSFELRNNIYENLNPKTEINKLTEWTNLNRMKIAKNMYYPSEAIENNKQGRVIAEVTTNNNGEVIRIQIIKSVSNSIDKEATRALIDNFPKIKNWKGTYPMNFKLF